MHRFFYIFLFLNFIAYGQNVNNNPYPSNDTNIAKNKYYYNIESASNVPIDSVYHIWFKSTGLKKFPSEVLKFKNLITLTFTCDDKL